MNSSPVVLTLFLSALVNLATAQSPQWQLCPEQIRVKFGCLNGGVCYVNSKGQHPRCVCDPATYGKRCEIRNPAEFYSVRDRCTESEKRESNCLNGGECFRVLTSGDPIKGCKCTPEWEGMQCEMRYFHPEYETSRSAGLDVPEQNLDYWTKVLSRASDSDESETSRSAGLDVPEQNWDYWTKVLSRASDSDGSLNQIGESIGKALQGQDEDMLDAAANAAGNLLERAGVQESGDINVDVHKTDLSLSLNPVDAKKLLRKMFQL